MANHKRFDAPKDCRQGNGIMWEFYEKSFWERLGYAMLFGIFLVWVSDGDEGRMFFCSLFHLIFMCFCIGKELISNKWPEE